MAKRLIVFIVSILALLALSLWLFLARAINLVVPPLVNDAKLQIDSLEFSSIGWRQAFIVRLSGRTAVGDGIIHFDVRDATVNYTLHRLLPGRLDIKQANITYEALTEAAVAVSRPRDALLFPPKAVVDELYFNLKDSGVEFEGYFELSASEQGFSALARDHRSRLNVAADPALSHWQVRIEHIDGAEIAAARVELDNSDLMRIDGSAALGSLLTWLRDVQPLPHQYLNLVRELHTADGSMRWSAQQASDEEWQAQINLDARNFSTSRFYGSAVIQGNLSLGATAWGFTFTQRGALQLHMPGADLNEITTLRVDFPAQYLIQQDPGKRKVETMLGRGQANLSLRRSDDIEVGAELTEWRLSGWQDLNVKMQNLKVISPYALTADSLESEFKLTHPASLLIRGDIHVAAARGGDWPVSIRGFDLSGDWTWNDGVFEIAGIANWDSSTIANWSAVSRAESGAVQVSLDKPANELLRPVAGFLTEREWDVSIADGSITAQVDWTWENATYANQLQMTASGIDANLFGLQLRNGSMQLNSSDLVARSFLFESSIATLTMANNLLVTDLDMRGRWQNGLYVDRADWSILGGAVKANPTFVDFSREANDIELTVTDIDLGQTLRLIDQAGLKGSGLLSGIIPLRLSQDGIAVNDGVLKSTTNGTLKYNLSDDPAPQLDNIALQALQDFRYDALELKLNYQTSGDYVIRSRIEGRNPQLYEGYPIAFNINLSGSLPGLLRASLITGDFHSEILRQIQQEKQ